jgi:CRP/FNR family cyclic AMP-dependent transcriptional regulator
MKRRESKPAALRVALLEAQWALQLSPELTRRVLAETVTRTISLGSYVCRKGDPAKHWIGVLEGLVKVASVSPEGKPVSFICVPAGGWFGEGALLKNERRLYDAVALRPSVVAYMPRATFMLLADTSVTFNRFLVTQLNERLGQFVAMVEHDRLLGPEARLAAELAALFNPVLYPGNRTALRISQAELAKLVGISRQHVNSALKRLEKAGLLQIEYGGITALNLDGLRRYGQ